MAKPKHDRESLWAATAPKTSYPKVPEGISVHVAVLGGGVMGLTTALLLKEAGLRVAVIEAERIALGVTAGSTVKVSAAHRLLYSQLERSHGMDAAAVYGEANLTGLRTIAELADRLGIDCDLERRDNYVWAGTASEADELRREAEVQRAAGLDASFETDAPELTFPVAGVLRTADQAQFHPRKFSLGLARAIDGDDSAVYEQTRAVGVSEGSPCTVHTERGDLTAEHVVVATHFPFVNRGFFFAKVYPHREYAVAMKMEPGKLRGMYMSAGEPTRSIRQAPAKDGDLLIVVGEGHKVGEGDPTDDRYATLEEWGARHFGAGPVTHRWSTQDNMSMDHLPFVGHLARGSARQWVATGYGTWGMTNAVATAMILRDAITGVANPWAEVFDAQRVTPGKSAKKFATENAKVAAHFVGDRLRALPGSVRSLRPGEGKVIRKGVKPVAVCRDDDGTLRAVSATCTHLGCLVRWNGAERSWDCPCHGSRFAPDGAVLHAPATKPLARVDLTVDGDEADPVGTA